MVAEEALEDGRELLLLYNTVKVGSRRGEVRTSTFLVPMGLLDDLRLPCCPVSMRMRLEGRQRLTISGYLRGGAGIRSTARSTCVGGVRRAVCVGRSSAVGRADGWFIV